MEDARGGSGAGGTMQIILADFSYYFSVVGSRGGLFSTECNYRMLPGTGEGAAEVRQAMGDFVQTHTDMLDRIYTEILSGKREPAMTDTPYAVSTGYRYSGTLTAREAKRLADRVAELFGTATVDPRGERSVHADQRASIECTARKRGTGFDDVTVKTKYELDHTLNVCCYRFVKDLPGVRVSDDARGSMSALERTLGSDWEREGRDHYRMLMAKE